MKVISGCAYAVLVSFVLASIFCATYSIRTLLAPLSTVPTCHNVVMHPEDTCRIRDNATNNYENQLNLEEVMHTTSWILAGVGALFFGSVGIYGLAKLLFDKS